MQFNQRAIDKFKLLYFKIFEEEISDEEVRRKAEYLFEVYRVVYGMPGLAECLPKE